MKNIIILSQSTKKIIIRKIYPNLYKKETVEALQKKNQEGYKTGHKVRKDRVS